MAPGSYFSVSGPAAVLRRFGGPDELELRTLRWSGAIAPDEILVRNHATSVNPIEWKMREGLGLPKPLWRRLLGDPMVLGLDYSGEVIVAGTASGLKAGDHVIGARPLAGAYARFLRCGVRGPGAVARLPDGIGADTGALLPFAGMVALAGIGKRSLRGRQVLVIGATGGVGHLAVQIARAMGAAQVAAICSARHADFARRCGADDVLAYDAFTSPAEIMRLRPRWSGAFDLILDASGIDRYFTEAAPRLLASQAQFAAIALPTRPGGRPGEAVGVRDGIALGLRLAGRLARGRYRLVTGLLGGLGGSAALQRLVRWLQAGQVVPHAGARFTLSEIRNAHRLSETGGTLGKIAISIDDQPGDGRS